MCIRDSYCNRNIFFTHKRLKNPSVLVLTAVRCALLQAHDGLIFHCRNSGKSNRLVPQKKETTDQNDFCTEGKAKKQAFQRCLWKRIRCMFRRDRAFLHILRTFSKNRHGNFAVFSFVGFSIQENIHGSESTRTLLAKAAKLQLNMYIHNIHLYIFCIKLISPVIAIYQQTVFPISLNCPTIPYKNFGGYPWKKIEKNTHESCCNLYIVSPII